MNSWNRLLALLDTTLGFPNKIRSYVKKRGQSFDQRTGEHVFVLEYRIKVKLGIEPPKKAPVYPRDLHVKPPNKLAKLGGHMETIRELMDVGAVRTVDSSTSSGFPSSHKRTTTKSVRGR